MKEIWKKLPKPYSEYYEVSNFGRVRSLPQKRTSGKILKAVLTSKGYLRVTISCDGKRKNETVHRMVAMAFLNIKNTQQVNHIDGDKTNNNLSNLEIVSARQNQLHRHWVLGISTKRKITDEILAEIRQSLANGEQKKVLAKRFGFTPEGINYALKREIRKRQALAAYEGRSHE